MNTLDIKNIKNLIHDLKGTLNHEKFSSEFEEDESTFSINYIDINGTRCMLYYSIQGDGISHPYLYSIDFIIGGDDKYYQNVSEWLLQESDEKSGIYSEVHVEGGPDEFKFNGYLINVTGDNITFTKE